MIHVWKPQRIAKGLLTYVPILDQWRRRRARTGGSDSARYCYSVWLRHLNLLSSHGFRVEGARIGEIGPGDSIGIGLAALLSGVSQYVGLDIVPFSAKADLEHIFEELVQLYSRREPIPDHTEFPGVRPRLKSYAFPHHLIDWEAFFPKTENLRVELQPDFGTRQLIDYRAPWAGEQIAAASLDLIFSQAVLEHIDDLDDVYKAMSLWLKPGGYMSHVIDFTAHGLSPFWNGHWSYSDLQWRLVRGRREFLLNREPLSTHIACIKKVGFEVLSLEQKLDDNGLQGQDLSERFQKLSTDDLRTCGAVIILRKPQTTNT